jgi:hypothetical protein
MPKTYDLLIRVSRMGSRAEGAESTMTIDDQRAAGMATIEQVGGRFSGRELRALNQSGSTVHTSAKWAEAVARARRGETSGFVIAYDDRLGRNWRTAGPFYDRAEAAGCEILFSNMPGMDYRTDTGRTMTGLLSVVAETTYLAARNRGNRTADWVLTRGVANRVPFGYTRNAAEFDDRGEAIESSKADPDKDGKALVPDDDTAPFLVKIFERRADGHSWASIARWLDAEGVKPRAPRRADGRGSGAWTTSTLSNIIRNPVYLGIVTLGDRPPVEGAHEPLVTRALWNRAQSSTTIQRTGKNCAGIAGGLLHCGTCGGKLSVTGSNPSYTCRRTINGVPCGRPTYVSKSRADEFVERAVIEALSTGSLDVLTTAADLTRLRGAWEDACAALENVLALGTALDAGMLRRAVSVRQAKVDETRAGYEAARDGAEAATALPGASAWASLDLDDKRRVAGVLIDRITVSAPASVRDRGLHADVARRFKVRWNGGK